MKFQLLYLAALASASVLQRDIQKPAYGNLKVVQIEKLTPQITKSAKAQITKFGPLTVQGVRLPLPKKKNTPPNQQLTILLILERSQNRLRPTNLLLLHPHRFLQFLHRPKRPRRNPKHRRLKNKPPKRRLHPPHPHLRYEQKYYEFHRTM
jgi:hypothetical protein